MNRGFGNIVGVCVLAIVAMSQSNNAHASVIWGVNGHEYDLIGASGITWESARSAALGLGAGWDLATMTSAPEEAFVISNVLPASIGERAHYWIGGIDPSATGNWQWVSGEPFVYTDWWPGEPNFVGTETLLAFDFRSGLWHWNNIYDAEAGYVLGYVVERTPGSSVPEPSSIALFGLGGVGLAIGAYRRHRRSVATN